MGSRVLWTPQPSTAARDDARDDRGATCLLRVPRAGRVPRGCRWLPSTQSRAHDRRASMPPTPERLPAHPRGPCAASADCSHHHRIVVWLLRYTGVRVAEAQALTVADLDFTPEGEALTIRGGKTPAATRTIPLLPQLLPLVHEHLEFLARSLSVTSDTPLLATGRGTAMTTNYLWRVVKRVAFEAGVRPVACSCGTTRQDRHDRGCPRTSSGENRSSVSPHTLRRTFGSDLINRGVRLEAVSKLLGHSSTTITERAYAQLLAPTIRREMLEAFARAVEAS